MKIRALLSSAAITAVLAHGSLVHAAAIDYDVGFVTVQDINISQISSLSFGQNVFGTADSTCTIAPSFTTGTDTGAVADTDVTDGISGAGCLAVSDGTTNNFSGIYEVSGETGQSINLTIASVEGTNFSFSPDVLAIDDTDTYSNAAAIPQDSPTAITLDSTSGNLNLVIGGTITIGGTTLTANTSYTEQFTITATY